MARLDIFVTVGMGPWPFDRLVRAASRLGAEHDVFVQTGSSSVEPSCAFASYLAPAEMRKRIAAADVVVTHAGNTVRLVQRAGKVPIAIARESARGEMSNDHQVRFLRREETTGRVVAVWGDLDALAAYVARHPVVESEIVIGRAAPAPPDLSRAWRTITTALELDAPSPVALESRRS
jgi:UDP-N-acetylglucosamine transferase subunit ALG13